MGTQGFSPKPLVFVIASVPLWETDRPVCYDHDAKATTIRKRWKYFHEIEEALKWAATNSLELDGTRNYISARPFRRSIGVME
jgi:hypothetical protein